MLKPSTYSSTYYKPHAMPYPSLFNLYNTVSSTSLNSSPTKETDHTNHPGQEHTMSLLNISSADLKGNSYITSEKYNNLCNGSFYDTLAHSDSTIFYDLDDIAKRHSIINGLTNLGQYNVNTETVIGMNTESKRFVAQSDAIVRGLAIRNHDKLIPRDSLEIVAKKVKRIISSDYVLRDDNYVRVYEENHRDNSREIHGPVSQPTSSNSQDNSSNQSGSHRGHCPCQLFSCTYTEMKSLPESLIVVNELTSTSNIKENKKERNNGKSKNKTKKNIKRDLIREHKPTNTSIAELVEVMVPGKESDILSNKDSPVCINSEDKVYNQLEVNKNINKTKILKSRKVLCPSCNYNIDVVISANSLASESFYKIHSANAKKKSKVLDEYLRVHSPPCRALPVRKILPGELRNMNRKYMKNNCVTKTSPHVIRIDKACRHRPPCTVVPSCQRIKVLNNNCKYFPPCLDHSRYINLPLCEPYYENRRTKLLNDVESPGRLQDSLIDLSQRRRKDRKNFENYYCSNFILDQTSKSNKSCQIARNSFHNNSSDEGVVYIRDVGCQFKKINSHKNVKSYTPPNLLESCKSSSMSLYFVGINSKGNCNTNIHTPRSQDNFFTNSGPERSLTMASVTSIDSECPSHGRQIKALSQKSRVYPSFQPRPACVTTLAAIKGTESKCIGDMKSKIHSLNSHKTLPVRHKRSNLKCKYKTTLSVPQSKKSWYQH